MEGEGEERMSVKRGGRGEDGWEEGRERRGCV